MAQTGCVHCNGLGTRSENLNSKDAPCNCVLRAAWRSCWNRFSMLKASSYSPRTISIESCGNGPKGRIGGRGIMQLNYMADLVLIARRILGKEDYKVFYSYYLDGATWQTVCAQLGMSRGNFFHAVYRIQETCGLAFISARPYSLQPSEYFGMHVPNVRPVPIAVPHPNGTPLRAPLAIAPKAIWDRPAIIQIAKAARQAGKTFAQIADDLRQSNVPTRLGGKWSEGTVCSMVLADERAAKLAA